MSKARRRKGEQGAQFIRLFAVNVREPKRKIYFF